MNFWKREETYGAPIATEVRVIGVPPMSELISMGWQERTVSEENHRTGATTVRTVEYRLLRHHRHTDQVFIQYGRNGSNIEPLQTTSGGGNKVTPLGVMRTRMASGNYPPAEPDKKATIDDWAG